MNEELRTRLREIKAELEELRAGAPIRQIVGYEKRARAHALHRERRAIEEQLRKNREEQRK